MATLVTTGTQFQCYTPADPRELNKLSEDELNSLVEAIQADIDFLTQLPLEVTDLLRHSYWRKRLDGLHAVRRFETERVQRVAQAVQQRQLSRERALRAIGIAEPTPKKRRVKNPGSASRRHRGPKTIVSSGKEKQGGQKSNKHR